MKCDNDAPYICIPPDKGRQGVLMQLACNDWLCKRCGEFRAKHEYGRIVEGARKLNTHEPLYFVTLTCDGQALEIQEEKYLERTNRLLTAFRAHVRKSGQKWAYASVTERQPNRQAPHSHYLMTCCPDDSYYSKQFYFLYAHDVRALNEQIPYEQRFTPTPEKELMESDMYSGWLAHEAVKAELGVQCRVSVVDSVEACSRYIAKYLFKETMYTKWPKGWRRVRYSQNWPKLPQKEPKEAFLILSTLDWARVYEISSEIECHEEHVFRKALMYQCYNVVLSHGHETIKETEHA